MARGLSAALAVFAALCFGVQVLFVEYGMNRNARRSSGRPALTAAFLTLATSVGVLWAFVVALRGGVPSVSPVRLLPFVLAGVMDPASTRVLYYEGIARIGPSVPSAITAGSPAVAAIVAVPVLGESLGLPGGIGLAFVVTGIAGLQLVRGDETADASEGQDPLLDELRGVSSRDLLYPVAAMVLIGVAFVVVKVGLRTVPDTLTATAATQSAALLSFLTLFVVSPTARGRALDTDRRALFALLAAGVVVALGWFSAFYALRLGTVTTVLPLVSTYPLVVVLLSSFLARDLPTSRRVLAAIALIVVGAGLLQLG